MQRTLINNCFEKLWKSAHGCLSLGSRSKLKQQSSKEHKQVANEPRCQQAVGAHSCPATT
eukprot:826442-Amphidinium_carterae.1